MININNLSFGYKKTHRLFSSINLNISRGGICGLLGKNGSGKTTLLKIIAGLIFSNQESCGVLGQNPSYRQPNLIEEIYYLQEEIFVPNLTIEQYVKSFSVFYHRFDHSFLRSCLIEFDMTPKQLLTKFSQGQKKKFLIAFGIATGSRILILDEPTNGLDIPSKIQLRKLLASTITDEKLYIVSTHQIHDVENLIDSLLILDEGEIMVHADIDKIMKRLMFESHATLTGNNDYLYTEKNIDGYKAILKNETQEESNIDLEMFFNALLANKTKFKELLGVKQ